MFLHHDDDNNPAIIIARLFLQNRQAKKQGFTEWAVDVII